jgi:site-specific DNA recombinase
MRAAVYARYSSENQRPESITDQVSECRRFAKENGHEVLAEHIYTDEAQSGARKDRPGLDALLAAAPNGSFDMVLVDDLSRLARDNLLMLSTLADLQFIGIRLVSVADNIDTQDEAATLEIQFRGIFNEQQLRDLGKKTLRGQRGQKERGFFVGERTFGYRSIAMGGIRMDKKGRPRPDGYGREIEPVQAALVLRIFNEFVNGRSQTAIVRTLNEEGVPGPFQKDKQWSPSTIHRMLTNEKYKGRWVWGRTGTRKDPRTGKRRSYEKPESEWLIHEDEALRIVPDDLWKKAQERKAATRNTWPGGKGKPGFSGQKGSKERLYPTHLLSGAMHCDCCGGIIAQVSGKGGGYYGCLRASKKACENKLLVPRKRAEKLIVGAVSGQLQEAEHLRYVLEQVEKEIGRLRSTLPETVKLKEVELAAEQRRLDNFIDAIGEGRGSKALANALADTERRVESLREDVEGLQEARERVFKAPPIDWIKERLSKLQEILEEQTEKSALLLRELLGPIRLEPVTVTTGKPFYRAKTALDAIALAEPPSSRPLRKGVRALCVSGGAEIRTRIRGRGAKASTGLAGAFFSSPGVRASGHYGRHSPLKFPLADGAIRLGDPAF